MGRLTREAAAARDKAAAEKLKTNVQSITETKKVEENLNDNIASYAGQPQSNTHEGVLAKEAAAQEAVDKTANAQATGQIDLLSINGTGQAPAEPVKPAPQLITQEFLDENPFLLSTGFELGASMEGLFEPINEEHLNDAKSSGLYDNMMSAGVAIGDTILSALSKVHIYDQAEKLKAASEEGKKVYHGDHLTKSQLGEQVTYDWKEVTAPEHLILKDQFN